VEARPFLLGVPLAIHFGFRGIVYGILLSATRAHRCLGRRFSLDCVQQCRSAPAALARQARFLAERSESRDDGDEVLATPASATGWRFASESKMRAKR